MKHLLTVGDDSNLLMVEFNHVLLILLCFFVYVGLVLGEDLLELWQQLQSHSVVCILIENLLHHLDGAIHFSVLEFRLLLVLYIVFLILRALLVLLI